ncbi:hypothetical protein THOE12_70035 [Vibrio rotiferianus]|nr:hypothetical protein THOE12_70035 [Vibrio rotiferianus]
MRQVVKLFVEMANSVSLEERDASQSQVNIAGTDTGGVSVSQHQLDFHLPSQDSWTTRGGNLSSEPYSI